MKRAIIGKALLMVLPSLCIVLAGCGDEEPRLPPDPAAHEITFAVDKTGPFEGTAHITGVVRNLGGKYDSDVGKQVAYLYEKAAGESSGKVVAEKAFTDLDAGETITLSYSRSWSASVEFPPDYILSIVYGPDIGMDGNEANDDHDNSNNRMERNGSGINDLF